MRMIQPVVLMASPGLQMVTGSWLSTPRLQDEDDNQNDDDDECPDADADAHA